jgi:hypothetical protein
MIPALDTFENMRDCLGATSVTLPTASDLGLTGFRQQQSKAHSGTTPVKTDGSDSDCVPPRSATTLSPPEYCPKLDVSPHDVCQPHVNTKVWSLKTNSNNYKRTKRRLARPEKDFLDSFLAGDDHLTPSWNSQVTAQFCKNNSPIVSNNVSPCSHHIWLDDRQYPSVPSNRNCPEKFTARKLYEHLKQSVNPPFRVYK